MNYLASIQQSFHCSSMNVDERVKYVNIRLSIYPSDLPSYEDLCTLISSFPSRDSLTFSMNDDAGSSIRIASNAGCTQDDYSDFQSDLYKDDPVHVTIEINKQVIQNQMSIYCYRNFCTDLLSLSPSEVLLAFTGLYSEATHLYFEVFDEDVFFKTGTMAFSSAKHSISWEFSDRKSMLDECRNVSCFYHQTIYPLLPEDFNIEVDFADNPLTHLFSQMSTALSITDNGQPLIKAQSNLKRGMIRWSIIWVLFILAAFIVIDFVGDGPHIVENTISILSKFISDIARYFKSL